MLNIKESTQSHRTLGGYELIQDNKLVKPRQIRCDGYHSSAPPGLFFGKIWLRIDGNLSSHASTQGGEFCEAETPRPGVDLGGTPPLAGQTSRLRGCMGLRVTGGGVMMMRTLVLSGCVSPGGKRGRNEVCNLVVVGLFYWNIREHPLPVDRHGDRAGAGASDCGVRIAGWPGPFQGWLADTIWRHMVKSYFSFYSHHR